jgi:predicted dehydrogenase
MTESHVPLRTLLVGCGTMGGSHARAYAALDGFELAGLVDLRPGPRETLSKELGGVPHFATVDEALETVHPDAVGVCTLPDTHAAIAIQCIESGAHVFTEKPLATTVEEAQNVVDVATANGKKLVVGYILRVHPAWVKFIEIARTLGKPLVMRMNLNQQSVGCTWDGHKQLMQSMSPIVDCGVHYVDVMCQMTQSRPIRVQAIGARLSDEIGPEMYNYGNLQVAFEDGSVGWYEAGWGPMMSEHAFFVKDVVGPRGCVSIVKSKDDDSGSDDIDSHTKTGCIQIHHSDRDEHNEFTRQDEFIDTRDEPDHQELCNREQAFFLNAIREDVDLADHMADAVNSLRIVLAADESVRNGTVVDL